MSVANASQVCVGRFGGPHGVRGDVKLYSYCTRRSDIASYCPLYAQRLDRHLDIRIVNVRETCLVAKVEGVESRTAASTLASCRLYANRKAFPALADEDHYYLADLVGLLACDTSGRPVGTIESVQNFGAGDLLEMRQTDGSEIFLPFTRRHVPDVMISEGRLVVDRFEQFK